MITGLDELLALHAPLLELDAIGSYTARDFDVWCRLIGEGPPSKLRSWARKRDRIRSEAGGSSRFERVVGGAFERANRRSDPDAQEERHSLTQALERMPARLPIVIRSTFPVGAGNYSLATRLDSPLNPLGAGVLAALEPLPDHALDRLAIVPFGPFTEYYVPVRDHELELHDPFSQRNVRRQPRSAFAAQMRDAPPQTLESLGQATRTRTVAGYLLDPAASSVWAEAKGIEDLRDRLEFEETMRITGVVGEALAARRLGYMLASAWKALDGDLLGFDGFPILTSRTDSNRRIMQRALHEVETLDGYALRYASQSRSIFADIAIPERGMLEPAALDRLTSLGRSIEPDAPLHTHMRSDLEERLAEAGVPIRVEHWSDVLERVLRDPVPAIDLDGALLGTSADYIGPVSSTVRAEAYDALTKRNAEVSLSDLALGRCVLRHHLQHREDRAELLDAGLALVGDLAARLDATRVDGEPHRARLSEELHAQMARVPVDPDEVLTFRPGDYVEKPLSAARDHVIGYRPDLAALFQHDGGYRLYIADLKLSSFSRIPKEGHRGQVLAYAGLLASQLQQGSLRVTDALAQVFYAPDPVLSDRIEPSALLVADPADSRLEALIGFADSLPQLRASQRDESYRARTKRMSEKRGDCDVCRERYSESYTMCAALMRSEEKRSPF